MPPTSLGLRIDRPVCTPAIAPSVRTTDRPTTSHASAYRGEAVLRMLCFLGCCGVSVWAFADPIGAAEAITNIDVSDQEAQFAQIGTALQLLPPATAATIPFMDASFLRDVIEVFVRVLSTLILLAAGGILDRETHGVAGGMAVATAFATATGFTVAIVANDDFAVLTEWFSVVYLVLGCVVPTIVTVVETYRAWCVPPA